MSQDATASVAPTTAGSASRREERNGKRDMDAGTEGRRGGVIVRARGEAVAMALAISGEYSPCTTRRHRPSPTHAIGRAPSPARDASRTWRAAEAVSVASSCLMEQKSGRAQHARSEQEDGERMELSKGDPARVIGGQGLERRTGRRADARDGAAHDQLRS